MNIINYKDCLLFNYCIHFGRCSKVQQSTVSYNYIVVVNTGKKYNKDSRLPWLSNISDNNHDADRYSILNSKPRT